MAGGDTRTAHLLFVMNTPTTGGAERHTFDLARALARQDFTSTIFAMKAGQLRPEGASLLQPDRPRRLPARILDLARTIRSRAPDVIVSVNERPALAAYLGRIAARSRVPITGISHSTILRNAHEERMQRVYTPVFNRLDSVVFISRNQAAYWKARGVAPRHETVILNGIETGHFTPEARLRDRRESRARIGLSDSDLVFGLCAVLRPEKNHRQLIEAVSRLRGNGIPAHALLVGDGPMRSALEEVVRDLAMTGHVTFAGMHADVRPWVAAFDVGVLPSTAIETLSLSALEIMAMGIPMVMSDIGGASEIVDGTNGRLVAVGDLPAFCAGLQAFLDPGLREEAGRRARETVTARFDHARMVTEYSGHLRRLASGGRLRARR